MTLRLVSLRLVPLVASVLVLARPAAAQDARLRRIEALERHEPTVEEVRTAALRRAALDPSRARSFATRSRNAGLLPRLSVRARRALARDEDHDGGISAVRPPLEVRLGDDLVLEAAATWELSRLVFDPAELRASREEARLVAERLDLETEVTRLYYERRRAQIEMIVSPPEDVAEAARRRLRIQELTAVLDAMTGGLYTRYRHGIHD